MLSLAVSTLNRQIGFSVQLRFLRQMANKQPVIRAQRYYPVDTPGDSSRSKGLSPHRHFATWTES